MGSGGTGSQKPSYMRIHDVKCVLALGHVRMNMTLVRTASDTACARVCGHMLCPRLAIAYIDHPESLRTRVLVADLRASYARFTNAGDSSKAGPQRPCASAASKDAITRRSHRRADSGFASMLPEGQRSGASWLLHDFSGHLWAMPATPRIASSESNEDAAGLQYASGHRQKRPLATMWTY